MKILFGMLLTTYSKVILAKLLWKLNPKGYFANLNHRYYIKITIPYDAMENVISKSPAVKIEKK